MCPNPKTNTTPKYALKKLSIGVASIMIGIMFYGTSASADNQTPDLTKQIPASLSSPTPETNTNRQPTETSAEQATDNAIEQPKDSKDNVSVQPAATTSNEYGALDVTKWQGKLNYDNSYELTNYTGDISHVVVPNLNDLTNIDAKSITIDPKVLFDLTQNGMETLQISHTTGKQNDKVGVYESAETGYLRSAFGGTVSTTSNKPVYNPAISSDTTKPSYIYNTNNTEFGSKLTAMDLGNLDVSNIQNFDGMFAGLCNLQTLSGLNNWNTTNGTNFTSMFESARKLITLNLSNWNTAKATTMNGMFRDMTSLQTLGDLSRWNTTNVTDMSNLFYNDENLTSLNFINQWNVENVKSISGMFANNKKLTSLDLSKWDTANVTDMSFAFQNNSNLTSIKGLNQLKTDKVTNMSYLFANDGQLSSITDINNWNTSNVQTMSQMFTNDPYYVQNLDFSKWNTENVTKFDHFASIDLDGLATLAAQLNTTVDKLRQWNNHTIEKLNIAKAVDLRSMLSGYAQFTGILNLSGYDFSNTQHMGMFIDPYVNAVIYLGNNHTVPLTDRNVFTDGNIGKPGHIKESNQSAYRIIFSDDQRLLNQQKFYNYLHILENGNNIDNIAIPTIIQPTSQMPNENQTAWGQAQLTSAINNAIASGNQYLHDQGIQIDTKSTPQSDNLIDTVNAFYGVMPIIVEQAYQFIDDDLNEQPVGTPINIKGQLSKTATVNLNIPTHYQLALKQTLPNTTPTLTDNNKVILIHLTHHHSDVTGQNVTDPVTKQAIDDHVNRVYQLIEDLPDGSRKTILQLNAQIYQTTTRDDVTGKITYGQYGPLKQNQYTHTSTNLTTELDSSPDRILAKVDTVPGYHYQINRAGHNDNRFDYSYAEGLTIFEITKNDTWAPYPGYGIDLFNKTNQQLNTVPDSETFHIQYIPDAKVVTVNYYDLTGTKVTTQTVNSVYNADIKIVPTIPDNYVLMDNQNTNLHVNLQDNELDLVIVPITTTQQESKTIQRIITINRPNHQPSLTVTQTVKFTRQKITNNIDQTIQYTPWIANGAGTFQTYIPTTIDGYISPVINSQTVNATDTDTSITAAYTPIQTQQVPKYIDAAGQTYNNLPTGFHIINGQNPNAGAMLIAKNQQPLSNKVEYVTRTIIIVMPNGKSRKITQKVRKGTTFPKPAIPRIKGYTTDLDINKLNNVIADTDENVTITFKR